VLQALSQHVTDLLQNHLVRRPSISLQHPGRAPAEIGPPSALPRAAAELFFHRNRVGRTRCRPRQLSRILEAPRRSAGRGRCVDPAHPSSRLPIRATETGLGTPATSCRGRRLSAPSTMPMRRVTTREKAPLLPPPASHCCRADPRNRLLAGLWSQRKRLLGLEHRHPTRSRSRAPQVSAAAAAIASTSRRVGLHAAVQQQAAVLRVPTAFRRSFHGQVDHPFGAAMASASGALLASWPSGDRPESDCRLRMIRQPGCWARLNHGAAMARLPSSQGQLPVQQARASQENAAAWPMVSIAGGNPG